jgi:hypothetical protein
MGATSRETAPEPIGRLKPPGRGRRSPQFHPRSAARTTLSSASRKQDVSALLNGAGPPVATPVSRRCRANSRPASEYRAKWGLPSDYPMAAPAYSERQSEMAKRLGLGQKMREARANKGAAPKRGARRKGKAAAAE